MAKPKDKNVKEKIDFVDILFSVSVEQFKFVLKGKIFKFFLDTSEEPNRVHFYRLSACGQTVKFKSEIS